MKRSQTAVFAGVLCAVGFLIWLSTEVILGGTTAFDQSLRDFAHRHASAGLTTVMRAFTFIGSPPVLWPLVALAALLFWRSGWERDAVTLGLCMLGALAWEIGLKLAFHRVRPEPFFGLVAPESYSYPSGHALFSTCFCGCCAWILTKRTIRRVNRVLVWVGAAVIVLLIGFSRIYLGVHFPSDVAAGFGVGFAWTAALAGWEASRQLRQ